MIYFIDYDFLDSICSSVVFQAWKDDGQTVEINASEEKEFKLAVYHSAFNSIEFFVDEQPEELNIEIIRQGSGEIILSERAQNFFIDGRTSKLGMCIEGKVRFAPGDYIVKFKNFGNDTVKIYGTEEGALNAFITQNTYIAHQIVMFILFIIVFSGIFIWKYAFAVYDLPRIFLSIAIPLSLVYLVLFVPWSQPDTGSHFLASYRYSNYILGLDENLGRQEDMEFFQNVWGRNNNPSLMSYSGVIHNIHLKCSETNLVEMARSKKMDYYSIINYLPEALGLALGRKLKLNIVLCLYISRISILVIYILLCYYSILHTPTGKSIFMTVSLLPMSLMMSSAISYDPMVIALSMAFIASILYLKKSSQPLRGWIDTIIWSFLLGAVKGGGYLLVLLPMILILLEDNRQHSFRMICVVVTGIVSIIIFDKIIPKNHLFQLGEKGTSNLSAVYALRKPIEYISMSMLSYVQNLDSLVINTGGTYLAWLEWTMPSFVVMLLYFLGALSAMYEKNEIILNLKEYEIMLSVVLIGIIGTPAMLLSWTTIGSKSIAGLQGRYYLPFVPLVMLVLTKKNSISLIKRNEGKMIKEFWRAFYLLSIVAIYYMMRLYLTR